MQKDLDSHTNQVGKKWEFDFTQEKPKTADSNSS